MLFTFDTTGDWDTAGNWEQNALPSATDNILISAAQTLTLNRDRTINNIDVDGAIVVGSDAFTVTGASDIDGTITISTGTVDANDIFDATNGMITFSGAGNLTLDSTVTSLGTLSADNGTVTYDGIDQTVFAGIYYNLRAGGGSGTKTLGGDVTVSGDLTIDASVTIAMGANDLTVTGVTDIDGVVAVADNILTLSGASDIDGTMTISTGTVDANGTFDATGGFVTFTGTGNLTLASVVTGLGVLSGDGTVAYDGAGDQGIVEDIYYNTLITSTVISHCTITGQYT
jgi:hypothetical protein